MKTIREMLLFVCMVTIFGLVTPANATDKTVKNAFLTEMFGFYNISEYGDYSGYNFDNFLNLVQHTPWNYEFVVIEERNTSLFLTKAQDMLHTGGIDILAPYSSTSSRAKNLKIGEK